MTANEHDPEHCARIAEGARKLITLLHTNLANDEMPVWEALDELAPLVGAETCAEFFGIEG